MNLYESIKNNLKENDYLEIPLQDDMTSEIISSVIGQLADGMWENTPMMKKYWNGTSVTDNTLRLDRNINALAYKDSIEDINKFFATKIKQIVKQEMKDYPETGEWSRDNENILKYMGGHVIDEVRVKDAYKVYDALLNRKTRVQDSEEDTSETEQNKNTFINYSKDKIVDDLGTVYSKEDDEDYNIIYQQKIRKLGKVSILNTDSDMGITWANSKGLVGGTPMVDTVGLALRMEFDVIRKDFYEEILEYWDDLNADEYFED